VHHHLIHVSLDPPESKCHIQVPNGISIGSAVFTGLTTVTNRETDRHTDKQTTILDIHCKTGGVYAGVIFTPPGA